MSKNIRGYCLSSRLTCSRNATIGPFNICLSKTEYDIIMSVGLGYVYNQNRKHLSLPQTCTVAHELGSKLSVYAWLASVLQDFYFLRHVKHTLHFEPHDLHLLTRDNPSKGKIILVYCQSELNALERAPSVQCAHHIPRQQETTTFVDVLKLLFEDSPTAVARKDQKRPHRTLSSVEVLIQRASLSVCQKETSSEFESTG